MLERQQARGCPSRSQRTLSRCAWSLTFTVATEVFAACVVPVKPPSTAPAPVARIPFPENEYETVPRKTAIGSAEVHGQAFLKTRGGDVKKGAGNDILLNPVTTYSDQWFAVNVTGEQRIAEPDARLWFYIRVVTADAEGRFTFAGVPAGDYYLSTRIVWEVPSVYGMQETGGVVAKRVSVHEGDKVEMMLTR